MSLTYTIDPAAGVVSVAVTSPPSPADTRALLRSVAADPGYRPGMPLLVDRRPVPEPPSVAYVNELPVVLREMARATAPCRTAVLVGTPAVYGMLRMASALAGDTGVEVGAFRDENLARRWLAGDDDAIRR
jgi:hypothetical protein